MILFFFLIDYNIKVELFIGYKQLKQLLSWPESMQWSTLSPKLKYSLLLSLLLL